MKKFFSVFMIIFLVSDYCFAQAKQNVERATPYNWPGWANQHSFPMTVYHLIPAAGYSGEVIIGHAIVFSTPGKSGTATAFVQEHALDSNNQILVRDGRYVTRVVPISIDTYRLQAEPDGTPRLGSFLESATMNGQPVTISIVQVSRSVQFVGHNSPTLSVSSWIVGPYRLVSQGL